MKNSLRYFAIVLLLAQLAGFLYIFSCWTGSDGAWAELGWAFFGWFPIMWYVGLIVFTGVILKNGNEQSRKKDRALLIVIGIITFFTVMLTFGGIS